MLGEYTVDTECFRDIMDEAKKMAASRCPAWTDFNYHDPGITIIELFSWLKEGQQYFMDQIGDSHKEKYLEFLGVSAEYRKPAKACVSIDSGENYILPAGTKFFAKDVCFETLGRQGIYNNKIIECFQGSDGIGFRCKKEHLGSRENIRIPVFGETPRAGECFYIGLQNPVLPDVGAGFYIKLMKDGNLKRTPLKEPMYCPMLKIKYEYYTKEGWKEVEETEDLTFGMLEDGMLFFNIYEKMEAVSVFGRKAYYFRLRVVKCEMDSVPVIENIKMNVFPVIQKNTCILSEEKKIVKSGKKCRAAAKSFCAVQGENRLYVKCGELYYPVPFHEKYISPNKDEAEFVFELPKDEGSGLLIVSSTSSEIKRCIGIGNGFPNQEYKTGTLNMMPESVEILVHEIGSVNGLRRWKRVVDFGGSSPMDYHFTVDTEHGIIKFGDCERGMAPEGEIILISLSETLGEKGNVKAGRITGFYDKETDKKISINNPEDAKGGKNEESLDEAFLRARELLRNPLTAITYKDYESYVKSTPGLMIESCKVISPAETEKKRGMENSICIVVKPRSIKGNGRLSENYRKNILAHLRKKRMLGTHIEIHSPRYILVGFSFEIVVLPHYVNAEMTVKEEVEKYLNVLSGRFGAVIVYNELYGLIDMLDCVERVKGISIDVWDPKVVRTKDGNIILPPDGIIETGHENIRYQISMCE